MVVLFYFTYVGWPFVHDILPFVGPNRYRGLR